MKALILVDLQNDFVKVGSLAVKGGEELAVLANNLMPSFDLLIATQDFHPAGHGSFAPSPDKIGTVAKLNGLDQVLWPVHCVEGTYGAEFLEDLDVDRLDKIVQKGCDPDIDSYSGFFDNGRLKETELNAYLQAKGVTELYVLGLATDYCVKYTALDAVSLGYKTFLIEDACRGVEINDGDIAKAIAEMKQAGIEIIKTNDLAEKLCLI